VQVSEDFSEGLLSDYTKAKGTVGHRNWLKIGINNAVSGAGDESSDVAEDGGPVGSTAFRFFQAENSQILDGTEAATWPASGTLGYPWCAGASVGERLHVTRKNVDTALYGRA
jgi:hypothetical protein